MRNFFSTHTHKYANTNHTMCSFRAAHNTNHTSDLASSFYDLDLVEASFLTCYCSRLKSRFVSYVRPESSYCPDPMSNVLFSKQKVSGDSGWLYTGAKNLLSLIFLSFHSCVFESNRIRRSVPWGWQLTRFLRRIDYWHFKLKQK